MTKSEAQTRSELIDQQLALSGWNVKDPTQVIEEFDILTGLPEGIFEPNSPYQGHQFSDYVLLGKNGKPLAVIEAKKSSRDAAIGDALIPNNERVDHALQKLLASHTWTGPQRDWLKRIAAQTKANMLVDHAALDDPDLIFKREGGEFTRLDKIFNGQLQQVLETFNESIWKDDQVNAA
ncbi:MAG: type I restriction-modification enzyme R subunit C-terminal domain-containing protein [Gallionella sp.]|nr:type I restriction-modification enzyme R subunit C-terminal domain-containing protein [Gallionella sp.]MDD4958585.1 type I restriction-modification enzyme R subunit C-terminal domain-containing protein [Gallionella sp.]